MPTPSSLPSDAWTALVVEDEPRLREALVDHLRRASFPWGEILQAGDGEAALALCASRTPDVAFVDIRMPGMSGLDVATRLPPSTRTIFVTAYDAHAIEAFEAGAVDYLLKPVTPERLGKTLDRLKERAPITRDELRRWLGTLTPAPEARPAEPLQWITASSGRRTHWIPVDEVLFFQSDSKYTRVVTKEASYIVAQPIKEWVGSLDPRQFQQIHRSAIVNLRAVAWVEREEGEGGSLHLRGHEAVLPVSAPFMRALRS